MWNRCQNLRQDYLKLDVVISIIYVLLEYLQSSLCVTLEHRMFFFIQGSQV